MTPNPGFSGAPKVIRGKAIHSHRDCNKRDDDTFASDCCDEDENGPTCKLGAKYAAGIREGGAGKERDPSNLWCPKLGLERDEERRTQQMLS